LHTLFLFAAGAIITYLLDPIINFLQQRGMNRFLAIIISYLAFFSVLAIAVALVAPLLVNQLTGFVGGIPTYVATLQGTAQTINTFIAELGLRSLITINPQVLAAQIGSIITDQLGNLVGIIPSIFGFIADGFLVAFISIYMLLSIPSINEGINRSLPNHEARNA
jgi:predicted PurR-regulated permease PerM